MKILLLAGIVIATISSTSVLAIDLQSAQQITVYISVTEISTYVFKSGPKTTTSSVDRFIQLERTRIGSETLWSVYGAPSDSCNVDSRFSFVKPLFKIGGARVEKIRCSDVATQEVGTMTAQAKGGLAGGILSVTSKISGDVTSLGIRTKKLSTMSAKIDLRNGCDVLSVSFSSGEKNVVHHATQSLISFKPKCDIY